MVQNSTSAYGPYGHKTDFHSFANAHAKLQKNILMLKINRLEKRQTTPLKFDSDPKWKRPYPTPNPQVDLSRLLKSTPRSIFTSNPSLTVTRMGLADVVQTVIKMNKHSTFARQQIWGGVVFNSVFCRSLRLPNATVKQLLQGNAKHDIHTCHAV